jgi:hypothetical protein
MQGIESEEREPFHSNRRAMSGAVAAIIMAVVVVIGGVGAYAALSAVPSSTNSTSSCTPASICQGSSATNDVTLFIPYTVGYGQTYSQIAVGTSIPATVAVSGTEKISSFAMTWGPGAAATSDTGDFSYAYTNTGLYTLVANATTTTGAIHTGTGQLVSLQVNPNSDQVVNGYSPTVAATLTNGSGGHYGWIGAGGSVTVSGVYTAAPANTSYSAAAPTLSVPTGSTQSNLASTSTSVSATYTFANAGYYGITMTVSSSFGSAVVYQNYTWGIYVGVTATGLGCALCSVPTEASPHSNTFYNYEVVPGGAETLDPAADYYTVGYEVDQAFLETLIAFNGTATGPSYQNFLPEAATCVPGSPQCTSLYGNSLVQGNNVTFVLDPAAHFYDPGTGTSRQVYPADVMFSIVRDLYGSQIYGSTGSYAGFDIAGPLIPYIGLVPSEVNASWDLGPGSTGLHAPYNNTPYYVLNSMLVNDSAFCPTSGGQFVGEGCITFVADGSGEAWPALLQILAIPSLGGIEDSGWYAAQGATVPGFQCGGQNYACLLPGGVTTTTATAFQNFVATASPTLWDPEITQFATGYPNPFPSVGFAGVGSGPYYLDYANPGVGYVLKANPAYQAPTGCAGQPGCFPLPHQYVASVITYWEASDTTGISEVEAGFADTATFLTPDFPTMLSLVASGQLGLLNIPTLETEEYGFNENINLTNLASYDTGVTINIPANALAYEGLRAVLDYAYPYTTAQTLGNVIDGIDGGNPFGGFLPPGESAYYNASTPWPNYDTATQTFSNPTLSSGTAPVGSAQWYWNQVYNVTTSPIYDPQLASFSAANPLYIPMTGLTSAPNINAVEVAWGNSVKAITGGVVQFQQFFIPSTTQEYAAIGPGTTPWVIWLELWIPDYPSPINNWAGAYGPTGLWGASDAQTLTYIDAIYGGDYNDSAVCGAYSADTEANLLYWANYPNQVIPEVCQGTALNITDYFVNQAAYTLNSAYAAFLWGQIQDVYNNLQFTVGFAAANVVFTYAPWINPASINTNAMIGGGGEFYYQSLLGNNLF